MERSLKSTGAMTLPFDDYLQPIMVGPANDTTVPAEWSRDRTNNRLHGWQSMAVGKSQDQIAMNICRRGRRSEQARVRKFRDPGDAAFDCVLVANVDHP